MAYIETATQHYTLQYVSTALRQAQFFGARRADYAAFVVGVNLTK